MKAVVAAFNQEKALVGAFSVITNLRMEFGSTSARVPEKVCKKVKDKQCLTIPEETCRQVPSQQCTKVPALVPANKPVKECQTCETYEDDISDIVYDKKCERLEKPKCYTAHKEVRHL